MDRVSFPEGGSKIGSGVSKYPGLNIFVYPRCMGGLIFKIEDILVCDARCKSFGKKQFLGNLEMAMDEWVGKSGTWTRLLVNEPMDLRCYIACIRLAVQ